MYFSLVIAVENFKFLLWSTKNASYVAIFVRFSPFPALRSYISTNFSFVYNLSYDWNNWAMSTLQKKEFYLIIRNRWHTTNEFSDDTTTNSNSWHVGELIAKLRKFRLRSWSFVIIQRFSTFNVFINIWFQIDFFLIL